MQSKLYLFIITLASFIGINSSSYADNFSYSSSQSSSNNSILISQTEVLGTDSQEGYDIQLIECNPDSSSKLTCKFLIVNNQENRKIFFRPISSKMIDGNGNAVLGSQGKLGTSSGKSLSEVLPNGVPVNGDIVFEAFPEGGGIKYIGLDFYRFTAEYKF